MSSVAITSATPLFDGLTFALDLGNLSSREKVETKTLIQAHFGVIHSVPNKMTSCLVCSDGQIEAKSFKYRASLERKQPILTVKYIRDCIRLKKRLDMHTLALDGKLNITRTEANEIQEIKERLPDQITDILKNVLGLTCLPFTLGQLNSFRKPLYLPYMAHRLYKTLPDPPVDPEAPTKKKNNNGNFSLAQLRIEREKKLQQELEEKSKQITENERILGEEKKQKLKRLKDAHEERELEFQSEKERIAKIKLDRIRKLEAEKELKKQEERLRAIKILKKLLSTQGNKDAPLIEKKWKSLGRITRLTNPEPLAKEALSTYGYLLSEFLENQPPKIEENTKTKSKNTKNQPGPEKPVEPPKPLNFLGMVRKSIGLNAESSELPAEVIIEEPKKIIVSWAGQKVFIGGVKFDDLEANKTSKKDPWNDEKVANTKKERIIVFKEIFSKFGLILEWTEHWDEGYAMIVYESKIDAKSVINTLKDFKTRKAYYKELKTKFKEEGKDIVNIPPPQYYVRWPKFYQKILQSKQNKRMKKQPNNPGDPFTDKQVLQSISEANKKPEIPPAGAPVPQKPNDAGSEDKPQESQNRPRDGRGRGLPRGGRGAPRGRGPPGRGRGPPVRGRGPPRGGRGAPRGRGRG